MLAWGMLSFGGGYNKSDTDLWTKGLETLRWNADYLLKTIKDDPVNSATSEKPEFYIVYQVCGCRTYQWHVLCHLPHTLLFVCMMTWARHICFSLLGFLASVGMRACTFGYQVRFELL